MFSPGPTPHQSENSSTMACLRTDTCNQKSWKWPSPPDNLFELLGFSIKESRTPFFPRRLLRVGFCHLPPRLLVIASPFSLPLMFLLHYHNLSCLLTCSSSPPPLNSGYLRSYAKDYEGYFKRRISVMFLSSPSIFSQNIMFFIFWAVLQI